MPRATSSISARGGIGIGNLDADLKARIFDNVGQRGAAGQRPGSNAVASLYVPANLVDGDTITIGDDTFEVDIINTDSNVNLSGALGATGVMVTVTLSAAPGTAILAGAVLRIENEYFLVVRKISTTVYVCARAYAGSALATHADTTDVFVSNAAPAANISVPMVTTLTPAVFGPAFAAVFNWVPPGTEVAPARTVTEGESGGADGDADGVGDGRTAYSLVDGTVVLISNDSPGADVTAVTEDFANSTDNVWASSTFLGGNDAGILASEIQSRAVTAAEELAGVMFFSFPFAVRFAQAFMRITATGQLVLFNGEVVAGYDATTSELLPDTIVAVRNQGSASTAYITGFASTNTIIVQAWE